MDIKKYYLTQNQCYKNGKKLYPKGLMLHSVGCPQPDPLVFVQNFNKPNLLVCVHAFVGTNEIYQTLPWECVGWHGGGTSNNTHIGVELTEPNTIEYTGGATFIDKDPDTTKRHIKAVYENAVELFAMLCVKYSLNPKTDIISHKEGNLLGIASNHGDPEHLWSKYPELNISMDTFRKDVQEMMNTIKNEVKEDIFKIDGSGDTPSEPFKDACDWAKKEGIFTGDGNGNFGWDKAVTREQLAAVIFRLTGK